MTLPITVDFETHAIEPRPNYPPVPVSVAILEEGRKPEFLSWGHPEGNNCTKTEAKKRLRKVWRHPDGLLFHNSRFDLDVAETHLGLKPPPWHLIYDTLLESFLFDPNLPVLSLKPLAEHLLKEPPEEQDHLRDWAVANIKEATTRNFGAFISKVPASIVEPYAVGDVKRTLALHKYFLKKGFYSRSEAYERERRLMPVLLDMERRGVPIDVEHLETETRRAEKALQHCDRWIFKRLGCGEFNLNAGQQLADALDYAGLVRKWEYTKPTKRHPEGQRQTTSESLRKTLTDETLIDVLEYRSLLRNQINTFALPWLEMGQSTGLVYPSWNQVRQYGAKGAMGARTGRLSSSPNFQNIPMHLKKIWPRRKKGHLHIPFSHNPDFGFIDLRAHVVAPRGRKLFDLDYSQQELRILAHFAGGNLVKLYNDDPHVDLHTYAQKMIGKDFSRLQVKTTGFGIIYGMGLKKLSKTLGIEYEAARELRDAYREIFPGMAALEKRLIKAEGCETWGGRVNDIEVIPAKNGTENGWATKGIPLPHKLLNTLIQGSAADCTKEAMIRYAEDDTHEGELLISVHDELLGIAPTRTTPRAMRALKRAMESVRFEVPMVVDGKSGKTWRACK
jgi:DNA polymerase-1